MGIRKKRYCVLCGFIIFNRMGHAKYCIPCAEKTRIKQVREGSLRRYYGIKNGKK